MTASAPIRLASKPGIKRDGTRFEGDNYVDGQWVRFQRGLPRKIGGYRRLTNQAAGIVRQFYTQALGGFVFTHVGHQNGIDRFTIDIDGNASTMIDRTPVGFVPDANHSWNFDAMFDAAGSTTMLFANAPISLLDISSAIPQDIYYGDIYTTTPLVPLVDTVASLPLRTAGNIVVLHPYLFILDINGYVRWSDINDPSNFTSGDAGDAYVTSSKLVKGLPLRGGGQAPAGLLWSLDSLIRVTYVGGDDVFRFDTITSQSSILSVNSVIDFDGVYFWVGLDRFLAYNGTLREVPNNMNINWFFDNLNYACANKVFAFKNNRWGEIWWCYPRGSATECTHAVIFNVRENTWYDTKLPNGGRSAGIYAQVFRSPLLAGIVGEDTFESDPLWTETSDDILQEDTDEILVEDDVVSGTDYIIWRHEVGVDEIDGQAINAINAFFETADLSGLTGDLGQPTDNGILVHLIEPDFVQTGNMTVQIIGRANARAPEIAGQVRFFPPGPIELPTDEVIRVNEQRRELRFIFGSNTVGGNFETGQIYIHVLPGDGRYAS